MRTSSNSTQLSQWHLLPLAGFSEIDVQQKSAALTRYTQLHPQVSLNEIASLMGQENLAGTYRKAVVVNSASCITQQLGINFASEVTARQAAQVVFMFPGIGDHYRHMGWGLYKSIPYFREILDKCDGELRPFFNESLLDFLYPEETTDNETNTTGLDLAAMLGRKQASTDVNSPESRLQETAVAHPLVFSIEYSLAKLLQHWGIQPHGLVGYSLGEYVAATISGVLTLKDALSLVAQRAKLIQSLPTGKMLATPLSPEHVKPYLNERVSLSAHNGDNLTILAGETNAILATQHQLVDQQIACRLLDTTHAFHSHMMQGAVAELTNLAQSLSYASPKIPYLSNVTGTWITAQQAMDPTYWAKHMCQPVQYFNMLHHLLSQEQICQLIEVGPGQSLGSFVKQHPQCKQEQYTLTHPTLRYSYDHQDDRWFLLSTMRKLWLSGVDLQWKTILPEYPDGLETDRDVPSLFPATSITSQEITQQKNRGEKRREKQVRHRNNHSKRISS
ncbi:MAG: acyltransferase domain-containing protein [Chloroflexi bacterium]|nr:acyltransferase domain-containing protein [Chloroflexota bacterium]